MAKTAERKALKKGKASFMLIGKVKVTDKTFNLDNSYDSGWTDNSMYIGIDCGNGNTVFAEMRGGFFAGQEDTTVLRAYDKNEKDGEGKSKQVEIAWEDRLDESLLDSVSDSSLITVGVEKDVKGKTVYKKFLSQYDAIEYLNDYLEDGVVVNVKGNLKYSEYDGNVLAKKEITSIVLSKVEDESDFKATFSQAILVDSKSIGKKDEEKGTMALDAYVIDYVGSPKIDGEKVEIKKNVVFPITFEVAINEKPEITAKMLQKFFKPKKKGTLNEITVVGNLIEGGSVVNITEDDIPDDIKELIEMGLYSEEEAEKKCAVGNNNREKRMVILKPDIIYVGQGDERKPTVPFDEGKYEEADLVFYAQVLADAGVETDNDSEPTDNASEDDDLLAMLEGM
ncbi:hypothetical protein [Enterocloster bolteae]|uniref:hypothetical protein n=1 Tax=Enterocloster bolteae TaxID=208479 RepID=UPI002A80D1AC|nr:hypothetical protein [Enterocloster bolteae]